MAICKDPRLTFLNSKGYNVVLLPREGIEPLDILGRDGGSMERLGTLSQLWTSSAPAPAVKPPAPAAGIAGTKTDEMKLSVGLSLLGNVLKGMGADAPKLDTAFQRARKVQFEFGNVSVVGVDPLAVGAYLAAGDLAQAHNPFIERYFQEEGTSAYVITEVLKSNAITVSAKGDQGGSVGLDLPSIQQVVGAKVAVSAGSSDASDLTFTGGAQLTFGFKAFGILLEGGDWRVRGVKASKDLAFDIDMEDDDQEPVLLGQGRMISVSGLGQGTAR